MIPWLFLIAMAGLLALSAVFSGAETGVYSVSRVRLEAEAEEGRRSARLLTRLLRDDAGLLITLLIGNNLVLELMTHLTEAEVSAVGVPDYLHEVVVTLLLTPAVFLFGELVPKDLFRRRPHFFLAAVAPLVAVFRWAVSPVAWPLAQLSILLERLLGLRQEDFARILRREEMVDLLAESRKAGALEPHAEALARNVLVLRHTPLSTVAMPWEKVAWIDLEPGPEAARAAVVAAGFTRLPVVRNGPDGKRVVVGYLHQLDVLRAPGEPLEGHLRPLLELEPDLPLDRAVARLQSAGQRLALVGSARAPRGLVALMDLLATLAAEARFSQPTPTARIERPA
ncbi:MAG: CNNM domain-containing protein [Planctomycetota bacterium]